MLLPPPGMTAAPVWTRTHAALTGVVKFGGPWHLAEDLVSTEQCCMDEHLLHAKLFQWFWLRGYKMAINEAWPGLNTTATVCIKATSMPTCEVKFGGIWLFSLCDHDLDVYTVLHR